VGVGGPRPYHPTENRSALATPFIRLAFLRPPHQRLLAGREILFNQLGCRLEARTDGLRGTLGDEICSALNTLYLPQIRKVRAQLTIKASPTSPAAA